VRKGIVTGGCGFIGRRVVERLKDKLPEFEWLVLSNPSYFRELEDAGREYLSKLNISITDCDLSKPLKLDDGFQKAELIIHLASNTDTSIKDHSINPLAAKHLMDALDQDLTGCHLIFASSIAVCDNLGVNEEIALEDSIYNQPLHAYGRAKLEAENYLRTECVTRKCKLSIVRVAATYGCGVRSNGLFSNLEKLVRERSFITRLNFPGQMGATQVDDIADIFTSLAADKELNISMLHPVNEVLSVNQMIDALALANNAQRNTINIPGFVWGLIEFALRQTLRLEKALPFTLYNFLWRAWLMCGSGYNISSKQMKFIPLVRKRETFAEYVSRRSAERLQAFSNTPI
jgi:nucleoside-diphosphate-sugar epimerase